MIIVDFSQIMFANLMASLSPHNRGNLPDEDMLRHMILNSLRAYRQKFKDEYGELIIACDSHNYWRKQIFPFYKANRKKFFESTPHLDWKSIFEIFQKNKRRNKRTFSI